MLRATVTALAGAIVGALFASLLVGLTSVGLHWGQSLIFQIDHWVIYLCVTLGAGFRALTGAVIGITCFRGQARS